MRHKSSLLLLPKRTLLSEFIWTDKEKIKKN
jgi:hypothetical protein